MKVCSLWYGLIDAHETSYYWRVSDGGPFRRNRRLTSGRDRSRFGDFLPDCDSNAVYQLIARGIEVQ